MRDGAGRMGAGGRSWGSIVLWLSVAGLSWAVGPVRLAAQSESNPVRIGGLLRTGFRAEPGDSERNDGFDLFDTRFNLTGKVGIVFDYFVEGEYEDDSEEFRLLDARLTLPIFPEANISFGQFKTPFGREELQYKGDITFLERSLATRAIAPARQVGVELFGEALESRLSYRGGVFNGNGRTLDNDNDSFLYAGHVQYNTVGPIEFYDDLVVEVGASAAFSTDSSVVLGAGLDGRLPGAPPLMGIDFNDFRGDRFMLGFNARVSYRGFAVDGEYLRGRYDLNESVAGRDNLVAEGGYLQGSYSLFGAIENVVRWDTFSPAVGPNRNFLLIGFNVYPGFHAKLGLQYAIGLNDSPPGQDLVDDQFALVTQLSF
ncbi:MAG: porin [Gemmatimonadota bacterium]